MVKNLTVHLFCMLMYFHRVTGYTTIKFGKFAAFAIGGSIILMEIAHQEGFIKIDWPKLSRSVDKIAEKVESSISPHDTNWLDKVNLTIFKILFQL